MRVKSLSSIIRRQQTRSKLYKERIINIIILFNNMNTSAQNKTLKRVDSDANREQNRVRRGRTEKCVSLKINFNTIFDSTLL